MKESSYEPDLRAAAMEGVGAMRALAASLRAGDVRPETVAKVLGERADRLEMAAKAQPESEATS